MLSKRSKEYLSNKICFGRGMNDKICQQRRAIALAEIYVSVNLGASAHSDEVQSIPSADSKMSVNGYRDQFLAV